MVLIRIASREDTGWMAWHQRRRLLVQFTGAKQIRVEGTLERAFVVPHLLPMALAVSKQVIGSGKATTADLTEVWSVLRSEMDCPVCRKVREPHGALRALSLLSRFLGLEL